MQQSSDTGGAGSPKVKVMNSGGLHIIHTLSGDQEIHIPDLTPTLRELTFTTKIILFRLANVI